MLEMLPLCALAFLLLAGASRKFRSTAGADTPRAVTLLRLAGGALIGAALLRADMGVAGARWVGLAGAASIAAIAITLLLSVMPAVLLSPLRLLLRSLAATGSRPAAAPAHAPARANTPVLSASDPGRT